MLFGPKTSSACANFGLNGNELERRRVEVLLAPCDLILVLVFVFVPVVFFFCRFYFFLCLSLSFSVQFWSRDAVRRIN